MKKLTKIAVLTALTVYGTTVFAEDQEYMQGGHPFIGIGLGYGKIETGSERLPSLANPNIPSVSNGGFAWQLNAGYLWFIEHFAVGPQIAYTGFSDAKINFSDGSNVHFKANNIDFLVVAKYFFIPEFDFNIKGGITVSIQDFSSSNVNSDQTLATLTTRTNVLPTVGVGIGYHFLENWTVGADFQYTFGTKVINNLLTNNGGMGNGGGFSSNKLENPTYAVLGTITYTFGS